MDAVTENVGAHFCNIRKSHALGKYESEMSQNLDNYDIKNHKK